MYQCLNDECQAVFEHPNRVIGWIGSYNICPMCAHDEIEEISICQKCGEPATLHEKYCENCKIYIENNINQSVSFLTGIAEFDRSEVFRIITDLVEREG